MNKKVLTLCASALLAGAWTTLDAKVVQVPTPQIGNAYVIGTSVVDGQVVSLFNVDGTVTSEATDATAENEWTLEPIQNEEDVFYLKNSAGNYLSIASAAGENDWIEYVNNTTNAVKFKLDADGKTIRVAETITNSGSFQENCPLRINNGKISVYYSHAGEEGTELVFALYTTDDVPAGMPGLDNVITNNINGVDVVNQESLPANDNVAAPLNIQVDGAYLFIEPNGEGYKLGAEASEEGAITTLTASNSLSASWEWQSGKLVSTRASRAAEPKTYYLAYSAQNGYYVIANASDEATNFLNNGGLENATLSVSATSIQARSEIEVNEGGIIVDGNNLTKLNSVSGDYVIVTLTDGTSTYYLKDDGEGNVSAETSFDADNYDQFLWKVTSNASANMNNYTFANLASGKNWTNADGSYSTFLGAGDVSGLTLTINGQTVGIDENDNTLAYGVETKAIVSFYEAPTIAFSADELNEGLNPGFGVTIKIAEKNDKAIEGVSVFGKTLYAVSVNGSKTNVYLVDELDEDGNIAEDANYLVLDKEGWDGISANSQLNGEFIWVSAEDHDDATKNENWYDTFQFRYSAGKPDTDIVENLYVVNLSANAYVLSVNSINYLTTKNYISGTETWPYIKLAPQNVVDVTTLLGKYLTFSFAEKNVADEDEEYKLNGVLSVANRGTDNANIADYVKASSVLANAPEVQWIVISGSTSSNTFTIQNRETDEKVENIVLRNNGDGTYTINGGGSIVDGDIVKMTTTNIVGTLHMDGYMVAKPAELRDKVFHIGQYHYETGNSTAFWAENHQANRSHQLGVVTDEDAAVDWRLSIEMQKEKVNNVEVETTLADTIYVKTPVAVLQSDGSISATRTDTLAILQYKFQNKGNLEYVIFNNNNNLEYYQCQEDYSWDVTRPEGTLPTGAKAADHFALKLKADSTYNIVTIKENDGVRADALSDEKIYVANSQQWGSLKQMDLYGEDNNSLMQVLPVDRPEYRQIELVWGDTIKLWRNENESQVVYEKRDDKSVVEGDTLSFLNIDNDNQFNMNPAIFADTAYINRWDVDGVKNTCYQYLLAVNPTNVSEYYCPLTPEHNTDAWREAHGGPCPDADRSAYVEGRFLVNLIDTANVYGLEHLHNNPYINLTEEGNYCAKLSFVPGKHMGDSLVIYRDEAMTDVIDTLYLGTEDFNVAKFAFKYVDNEEGSFKIQTQWKEYLGNNTSMTDTEDFADHYEDYVTNGSISNEGYLRFVNGCLVVDETYQRGDVFNMTERYTEQNPTANESINANGAVSVVATDGAVVIKGAEGKNVVIATILGKVVANETINSDNETIAVPAGIAVVSVDGESFKVVVK